MTAGREIAVASNCANCHQPLSGRYCSACGQRYEPHIHSLSEFLSESTEVFTHADSRLWRTRAKFTVLAFAYLFLVNLLAVIMSLYTVITL